MKAPNFVKRLKPPLLNKQTQEEKIPCEELKPSSFSIFVNNEVNINADKEQLQEVEVVQGKKEDGCFSFCRTLLGKFKR